MMGVLHSEGGLRQRGRFRGECAGPSVVRCADERKLRACTKRCKREAEQRVGREGLGARLLRMGEAMIAAHRD